MTTVIASLTLRGSERVRPVTRGMYSNAAMLPATHTLKYVLRNQSRWTEPEVIRKSQKQSSKAVR